MSYNYIAVEGNIGAGKTSLCMRLSHDLNARLLLEQFEDNSFLPKFYSDPKRYAFPLEMSFLAARFTQLKNQLATHDLFQDYIVSDYLFYKCLIFSKITLDEDEFAIYRSVFDIINAQLPCSRPAALLIQAAIPAAGSHQKKRKIVRAGY
jgi:deoxyguanosine kinase